MFEHKNPENLAYREGSLTIHTVVHLALGVHIYQGAKLKFTTVMPLAFQSSDLVSQAIISKQWAHVQNTSIQIHYI